jgi:hypothetical protein
MASGPEGSGVVGKRLNYAEGDAGRSDHPVLIIPRRRECVKKLLFVCTANTCCSPMVQAIFDTLAEDEGRPYRAESAGTEAPEGTTIAENAVAALEEAGIYPGAPQRTVVNAAMVEVAELCLPWIRDSPSRPTCSKRTRRWASPPCQSTRLV